MIIRLVVAFFDYYEDARSLLYFRKLYVVAVDCRDHAGMQSSDKKENLRKKKIAEKSKNFVLSPSKNAAILKRFNSAIQI